MAQQFAGPYLQLFPSMQAVTTIHRGYASACFVQMLDQVLSTQQSLAMHALCRMLPERYKFWECRLSQDSHGVKPNKLQWRSLAKSSLKKQLQHKPVATLAPPCPVQNLNLGVVSEAGEGAEGLLTEGALGQP